MIVTGPLVRENQNSEQDAIKNQGDTQLALSLVQIQNRIMTHVENCGKLWKTTT
jgi:hypothetical protein